MKECCQCGREYHTYIPNTDCEMPDGTSVFYREPQHECPACDPMQWGVGLKQRSFHVIQTFRTSRTVDHQAQLS